MIANSYYQNASDVRKNWSMTIDSVVHDRPAFINRTHDKIAMLDVKLVSGLLEGYKYHVTFEVEDDGSVTGFVEELDLVENAPDRDKCVSAIIDGMKDYASDYYSEFAYWSQAPNRIAHIPYILKILISDDEIIKRDLICRDGKN